MGKPSSGPHCGTFYEAGAFYTVTYATSGKMQQIAQNPEVAVCVIVEHMPAAHSPDKGPVE